MFQVDALLTTKETVYVWQDSVIRGNAAKTSHSSVIEEIEWMILPSRIQSS